LGITTIFVTHDQEEAVILADRIALIFDGKLEQFAGPDSFYERPTSVRTARFFGGVNFIAGIKRGERLETDLGEFVLDSHEIPDGKAIATVRPEGVKMDVGAQENTVHGTIISRVYLGTYTRYKVKVADYEFQVVAEAESVHTYAEDDNVSLSFPREKLWLMPPE
jgi:ABC-type Fe3+/spermidine/putrescine transport system ATPase subunit